MKNLEELLIALPENAGRAIVEDGAVFTAPLLNQCHFVRYCADRGIRVTAERLALLERLGRFGPIFRVRLPDEDVPHFRIPIRSKNNWFDRGWAWDTTYPGKSYDVPKPGSEEHEAYYSIFQLEDLQGQIQQVTMTVELDWHLEPGSEKRDWNERAEEWLKWAARQSQDRRTKEYRRAIGLLCQFVSERYYPYAQSDQRRMETGRSSYSDAWLTLIPEGEWEDVARKWDPGAVAKLFDLTPKRLRHAYEAIAVAQEFIDPLANWHQLIQFAAIEQRRRLKGDALLADNIRAGAIVLRKLYEDLYGEKLPVPNEVTGQIFTHIPELEIRADTRVYLEYVANRYHLNSQPIVALFVEGPSEKRAIELIFDTCFVAHPGTYGIEIVVLGGVDVATGAKEDRFRAIFRLIDYLHHHQTITYLMLDNERFARKLKAEAREALSIHHSRRTVVRPDRIKLWQRSFEFDNFTDAELARALRQLSGVTNCTSADIRACRTDSQPGAALKRLYRQRANAKLDKIALVETLVRMMLASDSRTKLKSRPIIKVLEKVSLIASRNPLPWTREGWETNQMSNYIGTRRGRRR